MWSYEELESRLEIPAERENTVHLIVARPSPGERRLLEEATLSVDDGLVGDRWSLDKDPEREGQVTLMDIRVARAVINPDQELALPGDNFLVDLELGEESLAIGGRIRLGECLLEVTETPHAGCRQFLERFGADALRWVNGKANQSRRFRGVNTRVVEGGTVTLGSTAKTV